jgi:hypothetical protein
VTGSQLRHIDGREIVYAKRSHVAGAIVAEVNVNRHTHKV